jgi:hypothetical protein
VADTFKRLNQQQLPAAVAALYTTPNVAGASAIVRSIRIVNTDVVSRWFRLYQGGGAAANQITGQVVLGPQETYIDTGPLVLGQNESIQGIGEVAGMLTCTISGVESQ